MHLDGNIALSAHSPAFSRSKRLRGGFAVATSLGVCFPDELPLPYSGLVCGIPNATAGGGGIGSFPAAGGGGSGPLGSLESKGDIVLGVSAPVWLGGCCVAAADGSAAFGAAPGWKKRGGAPPPLPDRPPGRNAGGRWPSIALPPPLLCSRGEWWTFQRLQVGGELMTCVCSARPLLAIRMN